MKISDEEVQAALNALFTDGDINENMRRALEAACAVRKARKAKKRAKAKPSILDEDQQKALRQAEQPEHRFKVGDRVVHDGFGAGRVAEADVSALPYRVKFDSGRRHYCCDDSLAPESAKPEWNGKYDVGKAYRTRDGRKATGVFVESDFMAANIDGAPYDFHIDGSFSVRMTGGLHPLDLIGPWED